MSAMFRCVRKFIYNRRLAALELLLSMHYMYFYSLDKARLLVLVLYH